MNSPASRLAAIALALGLGFAAGWSLKSPAPPAAIPATPSISEIASEARPVPASLRAPVPGPESAAVTKTAPQPSTLSALAAAIAAFPAPEVPRGTGKISGRVRTVEGVGIPGAKVSVMPDGRGRQKSKAAARKPEGEKRDDPAALAARVKDWVQAERELNARTRETTSDPDGSYAVDDLPPGKFFVTGEARGYEISNRGNALEPDATHDLIATPVALLEPTVVMPDGSAPDAATLHFQSADGSSSQSRHWSPADPAHREVNAPAGTWKVHVAGGENQDELASEKQTLTFRPGDPPVAATFALRGRPGVKGAVRRPADEVADGYLVVRAVRVAPGEEPSVARLMSEGTADHLGAGDSEYRLKLDPGTYLVGVSRGWQGPIAAREMVEIVDSMVVIDFAVPAIDARNALVLNVFGPTGDRVRDVTVGIGVKHSGGSSSNGEAVLVKKTDGTLCVPLEGVVEAQFSGNGRGADFDAADVEITLRVKSAELGQKPVKLASGQRTGTVEVRFGTPATLEVTVAGYAGSGHEGSVNVWLEAPGLDPNERQQAMWESIQHRRGNGAGSGFDADGRRTLGPVESGRYLLVLGASSGGQYWNTMPLESFPVALQPGRNDLTIALPALHELVVEIGKPGNVYLTPKVADAAEQGRGVSIEVGKSGRATFERLPRGSYKLQVWGEGIEHGDMTVHVPASGPVKYAPDPINAVRVTVTRPDGVLGQAGFQSGDLIIAADGIELVSREQIAMMFPLMLQKPQVELTVQRSGSTLKLTLDPKKLMNPQQIGGNLEPTSRSG